MHNLRKLIYEYAEIKIFDIGLTHTQNQLDETGCMSLPITLQ